MDCSDVPYVSGPLQSITLDRAPKNTVTGNTITGADFGVRVEDDDAVVTKNTFSASSPADYAVVVGTPFRTSALDEPVAHAVVGHNDATIVGNPSPYRWVDGVAALRDYGNVALGAPSRLCAAPDIPRGPFVMVYAIALQDPTQPPVPPPAYTVPSLGVLPACT
jgi:parallel beta-helix repeat protein